MTSHERFGQLRLAQFVPDAEIVELEDWEYDDRLWVGEAVGFSEWLRLVEHPKVLRSLAIDFAQFPGSAAADVFSAIALPVRPGMSLGKLRSILGEPVEDFRFVPDRVTYEFLTAGPEPYRVSCTVLNDGGLSHLVIIPQISETGHNRR